jgi:uncharacterized protein (TIGR03437 family)
LIRECAWRALAVTGLLAAASNVAAQVAPTLQIVTDSLPAASVGVAYSQQLTATGGTCPTTGTASGTIDSGALPPGLTIVSPAGAEQWFIQGTPAASGAFQFTIHLRWTHVATSPFDRNCTDEGVKGLTMTVQPPPVSIAVDRTQIAITYHTEHFQPPDQKVNVTSVGSASVPFTVQAAAASGGNWLSATPTSGATPAVLSIGFSISGLLPGVYTGTVTVTSGAANPVLISVSLIVVTDTALVLQASPASFSFSYLTGGQIPPSQPLAVTVSGGDVVIFVADVSAPPNGRWLSANPAGGATPATLTVSVDPRTLSPGSYTGSITVRVQGIPNSAQKVPVTFTVSTPPVLPSISPNGVVSAANLSAAISPGAWVSIFGSNLSSTTRSWRTADFINGVLPTALDGVAVTIDGKAAPVAFVSPSQVNVLAPDDPTTGLVFVQVKGPAGTTDNALVLEQTAAPALFQFPAGATAYVAGTHADFSLLAGAVLIQQGIPGTPAKPGETIVVYGTGFGATQPVVSATAPLASALPLANLDDLRVRIGGVNAVIAFAGLISPGLYQFNVVVPPLSDGDQTIVAELRGLLTRSDLLLAVQH